MQAEYRVPSGEASSKIVIKKSRFIGRAAFTASVKEARAFIRKVAAEETGNSHVVYSYIIGHGNCVTHGMSDAGEPSGTAGRPVLEVLKGSGLGDITLVVVRYFGGTKLGTGGLVRAYTASAQETLALLPVGVRIDKLTRQLRFAYELYKPFEILLAGASAEILEKVFTTEVYLQIQIPVKNWPELKAHLLETASGRVVITGDE